MSSNSESKCRVGGQVEELHNDRCYRQRSCRTITLNRPERRNAMTPEMQMELIAALEDAAAASCRVLVLAGAGEAFAPAWIFRHCRACETRPPAKHRADAERIARLFLTLYELPMPTIAAVHGAAIAGGTGLATICDFTLATPAAKFGFTEVRIGFVPALVSAFLALAGRRQAQPRSAADRPHLRCGRGPSPGLGQ